MDRVLDAALAKYSTVEPRAGLDSRILANLRAQTSTAATRAWWIWTLAAGSFAVFCVVAALSWNFLARPHPVVEAPVKETRSAPEPPKRLDDAIQAKTGLPSTHRRSRIHRSSGVVAERTPRSNKFPEPQPLTPEEIALVRYVAQFPAEATLIAQAQEEYARESEEKMGISRPDTQGSIEEER